MRKRKPKVELVTSITPRTILLERKVESSTEYEARMLREGKFLELQNELVRPLVPKGTAITDYYDAGLPTGLFHHLAGVNAIEDCYLQKRPWAHPCASGWNGIM